jgi:hypothetical protein
MALPRGEIFLEIDHIGVKIENFSLISAMYLILATIFPPKIKINTGKRSFILPFYLF